MFKFTNIRDMMKVHNVQRVVFNDFKYNMLDVSPAYKGSDYDPHFLVSEEYGTMAKITTRTDEIYWLDINTNCIGHYGFTKTIDLFVYKYLNEIDFKIYNGSQEFDSIIELLFYYMDLIYMNIETDFNTYIEVKTDTLITKQINIKITTEDII